MIQIDKESNCCGCAACVQICPQKCITMIEGTLGSLVASVNKNSCINCGACEGVCPILNCIHADDSFERYAVAAYAKDPKLRYYGSSGGVFPVIAEKAVSRCFLVYGAAFDKELLLKCTKAEDSEGLNPLYKSKYLQSDLSGRYNEIETELRNGKNILFVSSPCQVAALKLFLGKQYDNLYTVDFFCHGVSSQKFFNECNAFDDTKDRRKTIGFEFRTKIRNGSTPCYYTVTYEKDGKVKKKTSLYFNSSFYASYQRYVSFRESCYGCKFAKGVSLSDLTVGDFHEIDRYIKGLNRFDGVSTIIVNSEKGQKIWKAVQNDFYVFPVELKELIDDGVVFPGATRRPPYRDEFVSDYKKGGINRLYKKYLRNSHYLKNNIYYHLPKFIRKLLKRVF